MKDNVASHETNLVNFEEVQKLLNENPETPIRELLLSIPSINSKYSSLQENIKNNQELTSEIKDKYLKLLSECLDSYYFTFYMCNGGQDGRTTEYFTLFEKDYLPNNTDLLGQPIADLDKWYLTQPPPPLSYRNYTQKIWLPFINNHIQKIADKSEGIDTTVRILSVACGTMYDVMQIKAPQNIRLELVGSDLDEKSLHLANENSIKHGKTVKTIKQDITQQPIEEKFDIISCNGFSFYVDNTTLEGIMRSFKEHLKKDGIATINYIQAFNQWNIKGKFDPESMDKFSGMMGAIPRKWSANFRSDDEINEIALKAGFAPEEISFNELTDSTYNMHCGVLLHNYAEMDVSGANTENSH
jgi:2-polyprenyl-3-methyl-5-hydroxy-6-metoxy-1,4-benzoquinol methylase